LRPPTTLISKTWKTSKARHARRKARHKAPLGRKQIAIRAAKAAPALGAAGALVAALATHGAPVAVPSAASLRASTTADARGSHAAKRSPGRQASIAAGGSASSWFGPYHHQPVVATHTVTKHTARKPAVKTMRCTGTNGMLPQNYAAIMSFLTTHGYTKMAAAGMAGNMYQESEGNPESVGTGGGGLIGFTPLPAGYVTGNPAADLHTQLEAVLSYNQQWAQFIPALNAATNPTQAADIYMNDFERPGIPAAYNREAAANAVASACGF
jgi:Phage tail lysozyme